MPRGKKRVQVGAVEAEAIEPVQTVPKPTKVTPTELNAIVQEAIESYELDANDHVRIDSLGRRWVFNAAMRGQYVIHMGAFSQVITGQKYGEFAPKADIRAAVELLDGAE